MYISTKLLFFNIGNPSTGMSRRLISLFSSTRTETIYGETDFHQAGIDRGVPSGLPSDTPMRKSGRQSIPVANRSLVAEIGPKRSMAKRIFIRRELTGEFLPVYHPIRR